MDYSVTPTRTLGSELQYGARFRVYPTLGLVATAFGTLIAMAMVPSDPTLRGALRGSGLTMALAVMTAPLVSIFRQPMSMFRAENLVMVGLVFWLLLDPIQGHYDMTGATTWGVQGSYLAIGVFAFGVWLGGLQRPWPLPASILQMASSNISPRLLFNVVVVSFTLFMFRFLYPCEFDLQTMIKGLLADRWGAPWNRGHLGEWSSFVDHLVYFGYLVPPLTVCLVYQRGWVNLPTVVAVIFSIVVLIFTAQTGSRRIVGVMLGASILCWITLRNRADRRAMIITGALMFGMFLLMQFMLNARAAGMGNYLGYAGKIRSEQYSYVHVDDNFLRMAQVIEIIPSKVGFVKEKMIVWALVRPIPRVFWPEKPVDPGFDLPKFIGKRGVSLSTSILGEWYMCFGWPMVLFGGWFHGSIARMFSQLLLVRGGSARALVYALGTMIVIAGMRSMIEMLLMSYILAGWMLISRLILGPPSKARLVARSAPV